MTGGWCFQQVGDTTPRIAAVIEEARTPLAGPGEIAFGFVLVVAFLVMGLYFTVVGLNLGRSKYGVFRRWFQIRNTPAMTVQSLPVGEVNLEGELRSALETTTPFSGTPCAYGCWVVEEERTEHWETVAAGDAPGRMRLADDTGTVLVERLSDPDTSDIDEVDISVTRHSREGDLGEDREEYEISYSVEGYDASVRIAPSGVEDVTVGAGERPSEELAQWCEQQGLDPRGSDTRRYRELVVPPGETVYVQGQASRHAAGEQAATTSDLVIGSADDHGLLLADRPEEELADLLAWEWRLRMVVAGLFFVIGSAIAALGLFFVWNMISGILGAAHAARTAS